jgi:hypothetical protein
VERVAAGAGVQRGGVQARSAGERLDRRWRERRGLHVRRRPRGDEIADGDAQRMVSGQLLVAHGDDEQQRQLTGASPEHRQQLDTDGVGPVGVLDHDGRRLRAPGEVVDQLAEQLVALTAGGQPQRPGDVQERPERPRRGEGVTAPHGAAPAGVAAEERGDELALSDPRLAGDDHHVPVSGGRLVETPVEQRQLAVALQQRRHRRS